MTALATTRAFSGPLLAAESLRGFLLWVVGFAGAFVFIEPSPYEIVGIVTIFIFALTGLSIAPALTPLLLLLMLSNIGYAMAVVQVSNETKPVVWVMVSAFLAVTAMFYAAMLGANTARRLDLLMRGCIAAAIVASLVAVAAYFRLLGGASDMFLLYGRARGTFNDPNVLGAFLVLPGLLRPAAHAGGAGRDRQRAAPAADARGAVPVVLARRLGHFALAAAVLMALTFAHQPARRRAPAHRPRSPSLGLLAIAGAARGAPVDRHGRRPVQPSAPPSSRATMSAATAASGAISWAPSSALDHPLGIGPLQFARYFTEDAHNTFLNAFMSGGWLTGFSYLTLSPSRWR